jgi:hypothetical protein
MRENRKSVRNFNTLQANSLIWAEQGIFSREQGIHVPEQGIPFP